MPDTSTNPGQRHDVKHIRPTRVSKTGSSVRHEVHKGHKRVVESISRSAFLDYFFVFVVASRVTSQNACQIEG